MVEVDSSSLRGDGTRFGSGKIVDRCVGSPTWMLMELTGHPSMILQQASTVRSPPGRGTGDGVRGTTRLADWQSER